MKDDILLSRDSFQLIIAYINNHKSQRDRKVRDTIIAVIDEFFHANNSTLLYICEIGDNKQSMRSRLFEYWFSTYNRKSLFTTLSSSIIDNEGVINFASIILRNDNPFLSEIISEFTQSTGTLSKAGIKKEPSSKLLALTWLFTVPSSFWQVDYANPDTPDFPVFQ